MLVENKNIEYKSLLKVTGKQSDLKSLAEACVAFANMQGGDLIIGIEDKNLEPPKHQVIDIKVMNEVVKRLRDLTDSVALVNPEIKRHPNGGEYFIIRVMATTRTIAITSSGKVFERIGDSNCPIGSEELTNLAMEKSAFQWEIMTPQKIKLNQVKKENIDKFINDIRQSHKVSDFIKSKTTEDILSFYLMTNTDNTLTNLGVLWLGDHTQRARLSYPITVQYIVYNEKEEKIREKGWHHHLHNPKELLLEIEKEAVELTYTTELPDGLFRKTVRQYSQEVIRELLINAIAHKKYTISGDIFIEVYPDRMTITNPGSLPLGINKDNILHERHRRNPHLIQTLSDLKLMEAQGSGYDLIYEKLSRDAKPFPVIESDFTKVAVTIFSSSVDLEVISILDFIDKRFQLSQKEYITLGVVAIEKKILSTQLANKLQLQHEEKMRSWIGSLLIKGILITNGVKKGTEYLLNPELFSQAKLDLKTSLRTIEAYKLEALIIEDLRFNGKSKMSEIQHRLQEISEREIARTVYRLAKLGNINKSGSDKARYYSFVHKKVNDK